MVPTPYKVVFLTLPQFTLLSVSAAMDVLRMANRSLGQNRYQWSVVPADPANAAASCGMLLSAHNPSTVELQDAHLVIVCGGLHVERHVPSATLNTLRELARRPLTTLGAICTGSYALAKAGVLDGFRATVHWENINALREQFPKVKWQNELYVVDRQRMTSGGGVAPLDMMLSLVKEQCGAQVASQISDVFSVDRIRSESQPQVVPLRAQVGLSQSTLLEAAALMSANIEEPLPMDEVARLVGVSRRQVERLFKRYVGVVPTKYYLDLRLHKARELLQQTAMPIMEISIACGFVSNPHFSHCYRKLFGHAPSAERAQGVLVEASPSPTAALKAMNSPPQRPAPNLQYTTPHERAHMVMQWQQSFWTRQAQRHHELLGA